MRAAGAERRPFLPWTGSRSCCGSFWTRPCSRRRRSSGRGFGSGFVRRDGSDGIQGAREDELPKIAEFMIGQFFEKEKLQQELLLEILPQSLPFPSVRRRPEKRGQGGVYGKSLSNHRRGLLGSGPRAVRCSGIMRSLLSASPLRRMSPVFASGCGNRASPSRWPWSARSVQPPAGGGVPLPVFGRPGGPVQPYGHGLHLPPPGDRTVQGGPRSADGQNWRPMCSWRPEQRRSRRHTLPVP